METTTHETSTLPYGPEFVPDLFKFEGKVCRLDYVGPAAHTAADREMLAEMLAESPELFMPSMYALTEVATGEAAHEFLVFGEGGFSPAEMAFHLATGREGATFLPPEPSMNDSLTCEHGLSADLCAGPNHYYDERF